MFTKRCLWLSMVIILFLILMVIPACGNDEESTPTATASATVTATPTGTVTPTLSQDPVKIGAINVWSGGAAMAGIMYADPIIEVVKKQVEDMGGILGGRLLEIKKYDTQGNAAGALSAATEAIIADNLSVVVFGGASPTEGVSIAELACEENAFYSSYLPLYDTPERECMVEATTSNMSFQDGIPAFITEQLQPTPQTVAILALEGVNIDVLVGGWKSGCESAGIETVYDAIVTLDVMDFSPYLTKIKYLEPDVLILYLQTEQSIAAAKQIEDLGGWGDIRVITLPPALGARKMAGAEDWLLLTPWHLEMDNPESKKFVQDFEAVVGRSPDINHIYLYFSLWTAIHAIEMAGTAKDGGAIAQAARSGELAFDTPMGPIRFDREGMPEIQLTAVRIEEGGKLVPFE